MVEVGKVAPDFTLPDQDGKQHKLSEYKGKKVVLYFYPKDDTPGCTTEACNFRDDESMYKKKGAIVLGVSVDDIKSHKKFADKYELPFTLLSDPDKKVVEKYEVWKEKKFMGRKYMGVFRTTFLIDSAGVIEKIFEDVKPSEHSAELLAVLKD